VGKLVRATTCRRTRSWSTWRWSAMLTTHVARLWRTPSPKPTVWTAATLSTPGVPDTRYRP